MQIILSTHCESLQGTLDASLGYFIVKRGKRFYSQRSRHSVPHDGHWRFIALCAQLTRNHLYIADVTVPATELRSALYEAHHFVAANNLRLPTYHARDILNLKTTFSL